MQYEYVCQINNKLKVSFPFALVIEILSSLQVVFLIFETMSQSIIEKHFILAALFRCLGYFTKVFQIDKNSSFDIFLLPIWCFCAGYILLNGLIVMYLIIQTLLKRDLDDKVAKMLSILYLLHGKLLFFPIQIFLLNLSNNYKDLQTQDSHGYNSGFKVVSILICIVNNLFALFIEFFMYQITPGQNSFAVKSNIYHQIVIIHKTIIISFAFLISNREILEPLNSILHLFFVGMLVYIFTKTLPFYDLRILKTSIVMITVTLTLSCLSFFQSVVSNAEILNSFCFFLLIFPIFGVKISFSLYRVLFRRILTSKSFKPEYAIQFVLILKELISEEQFKYSLDKRLYPNRYIFISALEKEGINIIKLRNENNPQECEIYMYSHLMKKLEDTLFRFPDSKILIIFMMRIYLEKLQNISRVTELLKKLKSFKQTIQVQSAIELFTPKIEAIYRKQYLDGEGQIELVNYFKFKHMLNHIKTHMLKESNQHLEFWRDLHDHSVNVKKSIHLAGEIDLLGAYIQKLYQRNIEDFRQSFSLPILLYSVYLTSVHYLPHQGTKMLRKYETAALNQIMKAQSGGLSLKETAVAVISLDPKKAGQILDVSISMETLFHFKKTQLIGKSFGLLFPNVIAKAYQNRVQQYAKSPSHKLNHKYKTYGKTQTGDIFELEVHFQLYSYMNKEIAVATLFKKISNSKSLLIVNSDGIITSYSKKLHDNFIQEELNLANIKLMQDIIPEFGKINFSFNITYSNEEYLKELKDSSHLVTYERPSNFISLIERDDDFRSTSKSGLESHGELLTGLSKTEEEGLLITGRRSSSRRSNFYSSQKIRKLLEVSSQDSPRKVKKQSKVELTIDQAKLICEKYLMGRRIELFFNENSKSPKVTKIKADVQIKPYILDGEVHKVITFANIRGNKGFDEADASYDIDFGRNTTQEVIPTIIDDDKKMLRLTTLTKWTPRMSTLKMKPLQLETEGKSLSEENFSISQKDIANSLKDVEEEEEKEEKTKEGDHLDQKTSTIDHSYNEMRIIKTLNEVFTAKKIQPVLKFIIFVMYLIILFIFSLAAINFFLSARSLNEIKIGLSIVNYATRRLLFIQKAWQWAIFLYTAGLQMVPFPATIVYGMQFFLMDNTWGLINVNNRLKETLSYLNAEHILKDAFQKNVLMYTPLGGGRFNIEELDTFTATDILVTKYLEIGSFQVVTELASIDTIPITFNNTANDYMYQNNEIILKTEEFLSDIIAKNIRNMNIVLSSEAIALTFLAFCLCFLVVVISTAYKRLFNVLVKIKKEDISVRIVQIKNMKTLFDQDFEAKDFIQNAYYTFGEIKTKRGVKRHNRSNTISKPNAFSMNKLNCHLLGVISVALIFVPILAGLFGATLTGSISAFESFETANIQVGILSQASYQSNMFLSAFAYQVVFAQYPTMLILNKSPHVSLEGYLSLFSEMNIKLSDAFLKEDKPDPMIESMLKDKVCPYLDLEAISNCQVATKGEAMGLLSLNNDYLAVSTHYITEFQRNPTFENLQVIAMKFIDYATPVMWTINFAYPQMVNQTMYNFDIRADRAEKKELTYFMTICGIIGFAVFFLYLIPLRMLKKVDVSRRKILKIIPFNIIQENKVLGYYIQTNFDKEVRGIRNLL